MTKANKTYTEMTRVLNVQRVAHMADRNPSADVRIDRMNRAIALLVDNKIELRDAVADDFGHRSKDLTDFADIMPSLSALKHARKHVKSWMRADKRSVEFPLGLLGAKAQVRFTPKGTVGIMAPWNFPVGMVFCPLACVLAAGNRALIKPSEFTEATSNVMAAAIGKYFSEEEVATFTGGPDVGATFASLPLDHIIFTGASSIGRLVMKAAAENLTPVTLELGGKSPVLLGKGANLEKAATRIMNGKMMNAGQICLAPDYAYTPEATLGSFVDHTTKAVKAMYPTLKDNEDYTSVVNQRHFDRLTGYLEDARDKGAEIIEINPAGENFSQQPHHKMVPTLVLNPTDDMEVMKNEIFGPILPVKSYKTLSEAIDYVNSHDHPLGLYVFSDNNSEVEQVLSNTTSGGATVNDVIFHVTQETLPFGGVGPSGMGAYHGREGFEEFSHKRSVYSQLSNEKVLGMFRPPFGKTFRSQVAGRLKK